MSESHVRVECEPDYKTPCMVCGQKPTVVVTEVESREVHHVEMCGPCFFGSAACIDPEEW